MLLQWRPTEHDAKFAPHPWPSNLQTRIKTKCKTAGCSFTRLKRNGVKKLFIIIHKLYRMQHTTNDRLYTLVDGNIGKPCCWLVSLDDICVPGLKRYFLSESQLVKTLRTDEGRQWYTLAQFVVEGRLGEEQQMSGLWQRQETQQFTEFMKKWRAL